MNNFNENDTLQVGEKLYYEANPTTKMDVPSFAYELVEKWRAKWNKSGSKLTLYKWIKENNPATGSGSK